MCIFLQEVNGTSSGKKPTVIFVLGMLGSLIIVLLKTVLVIREMFS